MTTTRLFHAVGDIGLVGLGVDEVARDLPEVLGVVAAGALARVPELHQGFPPAELQDVGVPLAVPPIRRALVVDGDPAVRGRPFVAGSGPPRWAVSEVELGMGGAGGSSPQPSSGGGEADLGPLVDVGAR